MRGVIGKVRYIHMNVYVHTNTNKHTQVLTHKYMHTHKYTHTCTHIHLHRRLHGLPCSRCSVATIGKRHPETRFFDDPTAERYARMYACICVCLAMTPL